MGPDILIVKLGYSETLVPGVYEIPSLGDILRTTPILGAIREQWAPSRLTWVVSSEAAPLLHGNPHIDRLFSWTPVTVRNLAREEFDAIINFESSVDTCRAIEEIPAKRRFGFRLDSQGHVTTSHQNVNGSFLLDYARGKCRLGAGREIWQKVLFETIGIQWRGQPYSLGKVPDIDVDVYDVGLNWIAGPKWLTKRMPRELWQRLHQALGGNGLIVSWQQGVGDLLEYISWINSCRVVVTQDSLGLHLGLALQKNVIGLFGSTDSHEIYGYDRLEALRPNVSCPDMPCYADTCLTGLNCMDHVPIDDVVEAVKRLS